MNAIGIALVWCIIQVTLLAGVAALVYGLVRRAGPPARALAALAGLVLIIGLTALTFSPWPRWGITTQPTIVPVDNATKIAQRGETASDDGGELETAGAQDESVKSSQPADALSPTAEFFKTLLAEMQRMPASPERETWAWPAYVAILFLLGAGLGLVRLVAGLTAVRSYRLRARPIADPALLETADVLLAELRGPKGVLLCESELLATAATIGWRRPLIILPADWKSWTKAECRAVLAHEIAHIARHDFPTWVAAQLALVFHFYHPLVHWLAARLRLEQELAADAAAAQLSGGQRSYLTTLAGMALRQSDRPLAWPARTFLPTRGTLMRRIEMLRDEKLLSTKVTAGMRTALVAVLAAASLAVAGLRGVAADRRPATERFLALGQSDDSQPKASPTARRAPGTTTSSKSSTTGTSGSSSATLEDPPEPFSLAWVPRDAVVVGALRPKELLNRPALAPLRKALVEQKELQESLGVSPARVEQAVIVVFLELGPNGDPRATEPNLIIRLAGEDDAAAFIKTTQPNPEKDEYSGQTYFKGKQGTGPLCFQPDERTVVVCRREEHLRRMIVAGKAGAAKAKWADAWKSAATSDAAAFVNTAALGGTFQAEFQRMPEAIVKLGMFAPLWQSTTSAVLSADLDEQLRLVLSVAAHSPKEAQRVKDTLAAVVTLGQNSLSQAREMASRQPGAEGAVVLRALDTADSLLDSVKIAQKESQVEALAGGDAEDTATLVGMLLPAVTQARQAARRAQAMNNLKQLALAMHNYADANKSFPPAVLYGPDGKTPYSWRVALLPYLDQEPLYRQYKFDEPWDSENNKQVLAKMPATYRDPNDPPDSTFSSYYGLVGPSTIFFGKEGVKISQITDGTSNTLMFVEAKRDIPWTKPEDIPYAADRLPGNGRPGIGKAAAGIGGQSLKDVTEGAAGAIGGPYATDKPLPKLGGRYDGIFLAALCDGSVRSISQKLDEKTLRALITRDGGEAVNINDPPGTAPGGRPATPLPTPPKRGN